MTIIYVSLNQLRRYIIEDVCALHMLTLSVKKAAHTKMLMYLIELFALLNFC